MRYNNINIPERPAFLKIVELEQQNYGDYTLQINKQNISDSIIKLNKRREVTMKKTVVRVKDGFENVYQELLTMQENLEAEIRKLMAKKAEDIQNTIAQCTYEEEIEVPDEEPVAEVYEEEASETVGNGTITY